MQKINIEKKDKLYEIGQILTDIVKLFFPHTPTYRWTDDSITVARSLFLAWCILWKEYVGLNASILQHVVGKL